MPEPKTVASFHINRGAICEFCGQPSTLLCDGEIANGKTCDKPVCRACAGKPASSLHINVGRLSRWDTRDLCPDCRAAGRDWTFALKEEKEPMATKTLRKTLHGKPCQVMPSETMAFEFEGPLTSIPETQQLAPRFPVVQADEFCSAFGAVLDKLPDDFSLQEAIVLAGFAKEQIGPRLEGRAFRMLMDPVDGVRFQSYWTEEPKRLRWRRLKLCPGYDEELGQCRVLVGSGLCARHADMQEEELFNY